MRTAMDTTLALLRGVYERPQRRADVVGAVAAMVRLGADEQAIGRVLETLVGDLATDDNPVDWVACAIIVQAEVAALAEASS